MNENKIQQIDVAEILKQKSPKTYKKIPKFIICWLKRIIHEKDINEILQHANGAKGIDFIKITINALALKRIVYGMENIPENGRFIFVANHPLGGLESLVLMQTIYEKHQKFRFVVNDLLMFIEPLKCLFIPVNKVGKQSKKNAELLNELYASDMQVLYFPAGLCSRKIGNQIVDLKWQKNFIVKAQEFKRDVIPIYIEGKNSNAFYLLANWRKRLGIKFNIEMLFLPHEMFKQRNQTIKLTIGKPIPYSTFDNSKTHIEWADWLKNETYKLQGSFSK